MNQPKPKIKRQFKGVVVSDKMDKTIVVKVDRVKAHPKYGKRYQVSRKFKVHDEKNEYKVGDEVRFIECRPLSKDKRWRVLKKSVETRHGASVQDVKKVETQNFASPSSVASKKLQAKS